MLFHIHFRLQATIFDFSLSQFLTTNGSVYINPFVLLDIENIPMRSEDIGGGGAAFAAPVV